MTAASPLSAMVRCPVTPHEPERQLDGTMHAVIGCGAMIPDDRDDEGLVDCPECGIWFNPDGEVAAEGAPEPTG